MDQQYTDIKNCIRLGRPTMALELIRQRNLPNKLFGRLMCVVFFESLDAGQYGTAWGIHLYCLASIQHPYSIMFAATDQNLRVINDILGEHLTTTEALDALGTGKPHQSPDREHVLKLARDLRQSAFNSLTHRMEAALKVLPHLVCDRHLEHGLHHEYAAAHEQRKQATDITSPAQV